MIYNQQEIPDITKYETFFKKITSEDQEKEEKDKEAIAVFHDKLKEEEGEGFL